MTERDTRSREASRGAESSDVPSGALISADTADVLGMKHALDDLVWSMLANRYTKEQHYSNIKIVVGFACCIISVLAYKPPALLAKSTPITVALVLAFTLLYWGMQLYLQRNEGDIVFQSKPFSHLNDVIVVRSEMTPLDAVYTLKIEHRCGLSQVREITRQAPAVQYWDCDGVLAKRKFCMLVFQAMNEIGGAVISTSKKSQ